MTDILDNFIIFNDTDKEHRELLNEYYKLKQIDKPNAKEKDKIKELLNKFTISILE